MEDLSSTLGSKCGEDLIVVWMLLLVGNFHRLVEKNDYFLGDLSAFEKLTDL